MTQDLDLFGNPYFPPRGRPGHEPTEQSTIMVSLMVAASEPVKDIAATLGVDAKTLRKHYGHILREKAAMLKRLRTKLRAAQIQQGLGGNAAALSAAIKTLDSVAAERTERDLRSKAANAPARGYVSKKQTKRDEAAQVGGKFAPPPPPPRLVSSNGQALATE
jgi:DNA-binding NarL/FixJ family response regulator